MINMLIIQCIGAIAYLILNLSYLMKKKKDILFTEIFAYIFFSFHFYLLNGITGAICNLIGAAALIMTYLFEKYKLHNKLLMSLIFIALILMINIVTFQNIYSIFPMIALSTVIISFLSNNENHIRIAGAVSAICWLVYAIVYKSYASIIFCTITLINIIYALCKNIKIKSK